MKKEEFINELKQYNHIIVYGATSYAVATVIYLEALGLGDRVKVAVTKTLLNQKLVMGKVVRCIDEYESIKDDSIVIIAARFRGPDIEAVLCQKTYKHYVYMDYSLLKDKEIPYENVIGKNEAIKFEQILQDDNMDGLQIATWLGALNRKELTVDIQIVGHCNLNCQGCDVFSPLVEEELLSVEQFEKDIRRLSEIVSSDQLGRITLVGGEPLLHPEINEFMLVVRKYFPDIDLCIFTNGIKLLKMSDDFWKTCRETGVKIVYTLYPINVDYVEIEKVLKEKEITYLIFNGRTERKTSHRLPHSIDGAYVKDDVFHRCTRRGPCGELKNGRMYVCSIAASFYRFANYFGVDIEDSNAGIDIYKCQTYEELMEKMMHPMEICKYCGEAYTIEGLSWKTSSKSIEEWT